MKFEVWPVNSVFEFLFVEKLENQKDEFSAERRHSLVFSVLRTHATNTLHSAHKHEKLGFPSIQIPIKAKMRSRNRRNRNWNWNWEANQQVERWARARDRERERKVEYLCWNWLWRRSETKQREGERLWERRREREWDVGRAIYAAGYWCCLVSGVSFFSFFLDLLLFSLIFICVVIGRLFNNNYILYFLLHPTMISSFF